MNKYLCKKQCVINNTTINEGDIIQATVANKSNGISRDYFIKIDESNPIVLFPDSVDILRQTVVAIGTTKIYCCYGVYYVEIGKVYNIPERAYNKKAFKKIEPICITIDDKGILTKRPNIYQDDDEQEEDMVNHPSHYTWLKEKCGIEVIDITRHLDFDIGNAVKYLLRHGHKPEKGLTIKKKAIQDLEKAIFYIKDKIEQIKKEW